MEQLVHPLSIYNSPPRFEFGSVTFNEATLIFNKVFKLMNETFIITSKHSLSPPEK